MINKKTQESYNYSFCLGLIVITLYLCNSQWLCGLLLIPLIAYYVCLATNYKIIVFALSMCISVVFLHFYIDDLNLFKLLPNDWIMGKIENVLNNYNEKTKDLIMLACFNTKTGEGWKIYDDAKALSVVYLFSVGGFQISMLKLFIGKIIRNKKISAITNVLIIGIYSWTLNFSPGIMRVLFYLILSGIFTKKLTNRYDILAISGILTIFFNPNCVFNYGWILSYICTYIVLYIYWKNICNKFLEAILINISCIVISLPFIMKMDNTINLNSIFLGIFVSCITIFAFCWFFLTFWIIWFKLIHELVANITYGCLKGLCFYPSVNVPIKSLGETFYVFYYLISYSAILFWDVYNYNYDKNNKRFQNESNI